MAAEHAEFEGVRALLYRSRETYQSIVKPKGQKDWRENLWLRSGFESRCSARPGLALCACAGGARHLPDIGSLGE